jgi:hypothetical protein
MQAIKDLAKKYGVTASLVGGSLVVGSVFGQCTLSPPEASEVSEEEAVEEVEEAEEEVAEEASAEAEEVKTEEAAETPDAE